MTDLVQDVIQTAQAMNISGLTQGSSGNVSARDGDAFLITPSSREYSALSRDDILRMEMDGSWAAAEEGRRPSSEWRIHRDIYDARPDVEAVVHAHPPFATALACLKKSIPAFHYMVAIAGGEDIRCAAYATFGTEELSHATLEALTDRKACLMAHHGLVACGETLSEAFDIACEVEALAGMYHRALQIGDPETLSTKDMAEVLAKFRAGYGYGSS